MLNPESCNAINMFHVGWSCQYGEDYSKKSSSAISFKKGMTDNNVREENFKENKFIKYREEIKFPWEVA